LTSNSSQLYPSEFYDYYQCHQEEESDNAVTLVANKKYQVDLIQATPSTSFAYIRACSDGNCDTPDDTFCQPLTQESKNTYGNDTAKP
jgi:hypothetical protein